MKNLRLYIRLASLSFILCSNLPAFASEEPAGIIEEVKGSVQVIRSDGQKIQGRQGLVLLPGDQVETGKESSVRFSLKKGYRFELGEDAQAAIDELTGTESEDDQPVLRLILGYLWARIQPRGGQSAAFDLHTPTAIMGVRGTEFDAVVSLDAESVFTVDEGRVEVESEDRRVMLDAGRMSQVEMGKKPSEPTPAVPKEKRNWQAWRKKRAKRFFRNLPEMVPKLRKRFEVAVVRSRAGTDRINQKAGQIRHLVEKVRHTREKGDRKGFIQATGRLKAQMKSFKQMIKKFRHGLNRVRSMGRFSHRVERFVAKNRNRFKVQELAALESDLRVISKKRTALKSIFRQTIKNIRLTVREVRLLRKGGRSAD